MTPQRLTAWRRRLGLSSVMDKRLARMIRLIQREEREACVGLCWDVTVSTQAACDVRSQIIEAIEKRKDEP